MTAVTVEDVFRIYGRDMRDEAFDVWVMSSSTLEEVWRAVRLDEQSADLPDPRTARMLGLRIRIDESATGLAIEHGGMITCVRGDSDVKFWGGRWSAIPWWRRWPGWRRWRQR